MKTVYRAIAGRIRTELSELARVVERTLHIWQQAALSTDDYYVDATALNLHGFYAGLERLLEIIADGVDQAKPSGSHWHEELLRQMAAEIPGVRPPVLSLKTCDRLDRYRGFRHVVRNVYTFNLDVEQIEVLIRQLPPTMEQASQELLAFAGFLEQLTAEV
jgi:AcrR family transcriptional regulator